MQTESKTTCAHCGQTNILTSHNSLYGGRLCAACWVNPNPTAQTVTELNRSTGGGKRVVRSSKPMT